MNPKDWTRPSSLKFIGLGLINSAFPVLFYLLLERQSFKYFNIFSAAAVFILGVLVTLLNSSVTAFLNWVLLGIIVLYWEQICRSPGPRSIIPLALWFIVSLSLGALFPTITGEETRISLYGGETNFTGFYLITFALLLFSLGYRFLFIFVLVITCFLTLSRTAAVVSVFLVCLNYTGSSVDFRSVFRACAITLIAIVVAYGVGIFDATGYVYGPQRLYQLNDVSSAKRIDLILGWGAFLVENPLFFFIGLPPDNITQIYLDQEIVVHNSFILKSITCGVVYTCVVVTMAYRLLPLEVFAVLMLYSLMLHGLINISLIVLIRLLFGSSHSIFTEHRSRSDYAIS